MKIFRQFLMLLAMAFALSSFAPKEKVVVVSFQPTPREQFGINKLVKALDSQGYNVQKADKPLASTSDRQIIIGTLKNPNLRDFAKSNPSLDTLAKEGFTIRSASKDLFVAGKESSGTLYACQELVSRIKAEGKLPDQLHLTEQPGMIMRGTCIGLQKTVYLPGRSVYEYPYTPENFPWFYDKTLWIKYLDMMTENRFNTLYLWNGHPFASLVKLKDYPYAVEVDDATFKKNEEMFSFLTTEADKRGIYVIQMFYNIIVSKPFAEHNHMKTQDRERPIIPIIADYTRKSIAAFIEKYPNVGLLITLGEAMNTIEDDIEWFTKTILPGVKDGLKALGRTDEPPIVLRGHDTDARRVMHDALPIYKNLYTMFKYNGESLTTYEPRDSWETIHKDLSKLGSVHISNVHILANLEPFRYASPDFIQRCVVAMKQIQGAKGLHLYPQASYWDWPYSADNTAPRLLEMDRDKMWYEAWGRYSWNSSRDRADEIAYWSRKLGDFYGCGPQGKSIVEAYELTGEISPKLLRTFGISDGNRQTMLLGMFMSQLVNPFKYNVYSNFWSSSGPVKEVLLDYAEKEWKGQPHVGETPPQIADEAVRRGRQAVEAIEKASPTVKANREEFARLKNDIRCYNAFAASFAGKVRAAMLVLRYQYSNEVADLEKAVPLLEKSVGDYAELVRLTENTYLYANSMQTAQRRIPVSGANGSNKNWKEMLPQYQKELDNLKRNIIMLKNKANAQDIRKKNNLFVPAKVEILNKEFAMVPLREGQQLYSDKDFKISKVADELQNLQAIQLNNKQQQDKGTILQFKSDHPVKVLVGYFNGNSNSILLPPTLETNASANDRGQADIRIANALLIPKLYPVNVYSYSYPAGSNELILGKGQVLILGFIDGNQDIVTADAGLAETGSRPPIDWIFY